VEARRTRNQGRVRRLEALRRERDQRRERQGDLRIRLDAGSRSGRRGAELVDGGQRVDTATGERWVVLNVSSLIQRGARVGLTGPNGAGKTTLLRLMLGSLVPDEGRVELGTGLRIAYFDQMRAQLDPQASVAESIAPGSEWIEIGGQRRHVM